MSTNEVRDNNATAARVDLNVLSEVWPLTANFDDCWDSCFDSQTFMLDPLR